MLLFWGLLEPLTVFDLPIMVLGFAYLILRIYLVEFKVKSVLGGQIRFLSRFLAYYTAIAICFNFKHMLFNFIVVGSLPMISIVFFTHDLKFFFELHKEINPKEKSKMYYTLLLERLTLHIPLIISGLIMYFSGVTNYIGLSFGIIPILLGTLMILGPLVLFDPRVLKKEDWPVGPIMVGSVAVQFLIVWVQM